MLLLRISIVGLSTRLVLRLLRMNMLLYIAHVRCLISNNLDNLMVPCEGCKDWYHPACVGMTTIVEVKNFNHFECSECSFDDYLKIAHITLPVLLAYDGKVELKWWKESCESALKEKHFLDTSYKEEFVSDYLCCNMTLDIFHDPVITPTFDEKAMMLEHLEKVEKFEPTTSEPLISSQLVRNYTMKEVVHAFLDKSLWKYKID
ncbi:hypothetical protein RIF29_29692 [Crotalaria pallida]|uniref:RING-type E3 ubiquitin transferase n=1 Tax=Crotalaria pallida TaxID=3830 RepID=A0AAN9HU48_CROPI